MNPLCLLCHEEKRRTVGRGREGGERRRRKERRERGRRRGSIASVSIGDKPEGGGGRKGRLASRGSLASTSGGSSFGGEGIYVGTQDGLEEGGELAGGDRAKEGARGRAYGAKGSGWHEREEKRRRGAGGLEASLRGEPQEREKAKEPPSGRACQEPEPRGRAKREALSGFAPRERLRRRSTARPEKPGAGEGSSIRRSFASPSTH